MTEDVKIGIVRPKLFKACKTCPVVTGVLNNTIQITKNPGDITIDCSRTSGSEQLDRFMDPEHMRHIRMTVESKYQDSQGPGYMSKIVDRFNNENSDNASLIAIPLYRDKRLVTKKCQGFQAEQEERKAKNPLRRFIGRLTN